MYLVAALGNPGKSYQYTRHNLGFLTAQTLARRHQIVLNRRRFEGKFGTGEIQGVQTVLLTPLTYMNLSGVAVGSCLRFFQIPLDRLIVVHDDMDLTWTSLRIAERRGAGGHKGVLSIIQELNTSAFLRVRMGIGRPPGKVPAEAYVLEPFSESERRQLPAFLDQACEAIEMILSQGKTAAMNRFNVRRSKDPISP